jgi:putative endonuclease
MYYVYILFNSFTKRYYVGCTPKLKERVKQHLKGNVKSTKSNLNYKLMLYCGFFNKEKAVEFERYLKTGSGIAFMKKRFFCITGLSLEA